MTPVEALTVTVLGMGVVFIGLVLCIACIEVFRRVAGRIAGAGEHAGSPVPVAPVAVPVAGPGLAVVPPDVLAVIVAVLEVERALYVGRYRSRLTLRRPVPAVQVDAGGQP